MANKRTYQQWFDSTLSQPIQQQGDDPVNLQFVPYGVANQRVLTGKDNNLYTVADMTTNNRGTKNIIWSSEGFNDNGVTVPALTANQKKATGSHIANAGGTLGTVAGALDFSLYRALSLVVVCGTPAGGASPSIQFELDYLDDAVTPNVFPLWKPTALTAAGNYWITAGQGLIFPQAATAATLTPSASFTPIAVPATWIYEIVGLPVLPNGQVQWTVTGGPTSIAWTAILYGHN